MQEILSELFTKDFYIQLSNDFVYQQLILIVFAFVVASLFKRLNQSVYKKYKKNIPYRWLNLSIDTFIFSIRPLFTYIFVRLIQLVLVSFNYKYLVLEWTGNIIILWFLFRIIQKLLKINLPSAQAHFWSTKLLAPIMIITVLLSSLGLLDEVLNWKLQFANIDLNISIKSLFFGIFILFLFIKSGKAFRRFFERKVLPEAGADEAASHAVSTIFFYVIMILGVLFSLSVIGINISSLTLVVSGLSIGIGFGLQSIVSNFVSGFILLFEKSVGPGDVINIAGVNGRVLNIGMRSITILTRDNIELIIPNSHYLTEIVTNLTRTSKQVRLRITVGVSYNSDPCEVEKALLEITTHELILKKPAPMVHFVGFGNSSLDFELLVWTNKAELIPIISSELRFRIFEVLKKYTIEIPFPQRDIHIRTIPNNMTMTKANDK